MTVADSTPQTLQQQNAPMVATKGALMLNQAELVLGLTEKEDVAVSFSHGPKLRSRRLVP
jgi:hypothetical protein